MIKSNVIPLVSICIPVYNGEKYISHAIESVLRQTYQNIELCIADNASTDGTRNKVNKLKDKRIKYEYFSKHENMVGNWNRVLGMAAGKYLAILSADDCYLAAAVEKCVSVLEDKETNCVAFSNVLVIDSDGKLIGKGLAKGRLPKMSGVVKNPEEYMLSQGNPININQVFFRTECLGEPVFSDEAGMALDYDLLLRLAQEEKTFVYVADFVTKYRRHSENASGNRLAILIDTINVLISRKNKVNSNLYDRRIERTEKWLGIEAILVRDKDMFTKFIRSLGDFRYVAIFRFLWAFPALLSTLLILRKMQKKLAGKERLC